jgi:hypothetical protein
VSRILTWIVATHAGILTSQRSTRPYGSSFDALTTLPYRSVKKTNPAASVVNFSPVTFSAQEPSTSEQLRTL